MAMKNLWLVWSNEHSSWWAPNSAGYKCDTENAGRYSFKEAQQICARAGFMNCRHGARMPAEVMVPAPEAADLLAAAPALSGLPTLTLAALPVGAVAKVVEAGKTAAEVERPEEMVTAADYNGLPRWARSYIAELEEAKYGVTAALAPFTQEVPANGNH